MTVFAFLRLQNLTGKRTCRLFVLACLACVAIFAIATPAHAQTVTLDLDNEAGTTTGRMLQMLLFLTVMSLAPSILVMTTAFTRIMVVFSILRHAMATNTTPPNMVMVGLALFLTGFIMAPTIEQSWNNGVQPLINEEVEVMEGLQKAYDPLHSFMLNNTRPKDLELFMNLSKSDPVDKVEDTPIKVVVPSFIISELRRSFEIGFLIYVPFLIIDMVIASVLMSMGMMMLPPTMLAMPFKLIFFVLIDGWYMLCGSLVRSFSPG